MAEEGFNEQRNLYRRERQLVSIHCTNSFNTNNDPNITPSFANLPAELQDFFSASDTDDLLSSQHSAHDLLFEPQPFIQPVRMNVPPPVLAPAQQNNTAQAITTSPITLLDNITSQLPLDKKEKFLQLFRDLQTSCISAAEFMIQSKTILGEHQFRQLEI
ncbi:unnamed protein product [Rhizopus stolonifer]